MPDARIRPVGDRALVVDLAPDLGASPAVGSPSRSGTSPVRPEISPLVLAAALAAAAVPGVEDVVPTERSVLVVLGAPSARAAAVAAVDRVLQSVDLRERAVPAAELVRVPVSYDGPDLDEVARAAGLTRAEVIRAHTRSPWTAAFSGFTPGFCYLVGGDWALRPARRAEPRAQVPAGAVAVAGSYSAVYPRPGPGGWQLLGTTTVSMWNLAAWPPATITPGCRVQFVDVDAHAHADGDGTG